MKKPLFLLLIIHCTLLTVDAQVMQQWAARYNGPTNSDDYASSITVDNSGNVYVTGGSHFGTGYDYATIKYNSSGDTLWVRKYNGPGNNNDVASSIAVDGLGNVYVTGWSRGSGTYSDYATIKYNSSGVQQWVQRYTGQGDRDDKARSLAVDGSGNVYVTGESEGSGIGRDYATIKYNSSGDSLWVKRYNGPENDDDKAYSLAVDGSGNVYVTGASWRNGTLYDYATIKYNFAGVQQWAARYNGPGNGYDEAKSIIVDGSGNVYVTGYSVGDGTGISDYATIKYNSSGDSLWVRRYNGPANDGDYASSLKVDSSGNVYVTGESVGIGTGYSDYATLKYNSSGSQQWEARYNGPENAYDQAYSITVDNSDNVYVTGGIHFGTGYDYATLKYNSSGAQQWEARYNGPGNYNDVANSIATDGFGNVYVTGSSGGSGTGGDYATIKYSQMVGITPISNQIPDAFRLEQNYPNPFNPTTVISFQLTVSSFASLKVYDVLGREVEVLVNEQLNAGIYEADFDGSNFASGVYFYVMKTESFTGIKKMIIIK